MLQLIVISIASLPFSLCEKPQVMPIGDSRVVRVGDYPWFVGIGFYENGQFKVVCGGSLIRPDWVLTAAHCFKDDFDFYVVPKIYNLSMISNYNKYLARRIIKNENHRNNAKHDDIALLQFDGHDHSSDKQIDYTNINAKRTMLRRCVIMGFGEIDKKTYRLEDLKNKRHKVLEEVDVTIESDGMCSKMIGKNYDEKGQVCARSANENRNPGACQGDSGGPLVCYTLRGTEHQVGIVSYGYSCDAKDHASSFTYVRSYIDWINRVIENNKNYYNELKGTITSRNYPYEYEPNLSYQIDIIIPDVKVFEIKFSHFDVESGSDNLTIYDYQRKYYHFLSGSYLPHKLVIPSNHIIIKFNSDDKGKNKGFHLKYKAWNKFLGYLFL